MDNIKKIKILIIDTSAVLSGKPVFFDNVITATTPGVSNELKPGGRDYQTFQFLKEKGLKIIPPSKTSLDKIKNVSTETGDIGRLSKTDIEILALALDYSNEKDKEPVIKEIDRLLEHSLAPVTLCHKGEDGKEHKTKVELDGGQAILLPFREDSRSIHDRIRFGNKTTH